MGWENGLFALHLLNDCKLQFSIKLKCHCFNVSDQKKKCSKKHSFGSKTSDHEEKGRGISRDLLDLRFQRARVI